MNRFHVDIPIFQTSVIVITDCDKEAAENAFYDYADMRSKVSLNTRSIGAVRTFEGDIYMWVKDSSQASVVFHELTHVAYALCELTGMAFDEELIAYLIGWLKTEVADKIFYREENKNGRQTSSL